MIQYNISNQSICTSIATNPAKSNDNHQPKNLSQAEKTSRHQEHCGSWIVRILNNGLIWCIWGLVFEDWYCKDIYNNFTGQGQWVIRFNFLYAVYKQEILSTPRTKRHQDIKSICLLLKHVKGINPHPLYSRTLTRIYNDTKTSHPYPKCGFLTMNTSART